MANGDVTSNAKKIGDMAANYFADLFSASPYHVDTELFNEIYPTITTTTNKGFCSLPSMDEIREATTILNPASARGNDGFTAIFIAHVGI